MRSFFRALERRGAEYLLISGQRLEPLGVRLDARHEPARRVLVEVGRREREEVGEDVLLQARDDREPDPRDDDHLGEGRAHADDEDPGVGERREHDPAPVARADLLVDPVAEDERAGELGGDRGEEQDDGDPDRAGVPIGSWIGARLRERPIGSDGRDGSPLELEGSHPLDRADRHGGRRLPGVRGRPRPRRVRRRRPAARASVARRDAVEPGHRSGASGPAPRLSDPLRPTSSRAAVSSPVSRSSTGTSSSSPTAPGTTPRLLRRVDPRGPAAPGGAVNDVAGPP